MPIVKINGSGVSFSRYVQDLCRRRGGSFPKGCPNYGKKPGCPPQPLIDKVLDLSQDVFVIYTDFNVRHVANRMRKAHPNWTTKQCYNPRYWQQTARKLHFEDILTFLKDVDKTEYLKTKVIMCPEAHGINLDSMMLMSLNIKLEWPPRNITRIISLAGQLI